MNTISGTRRKRLKRRGIRTTKTPGGIMYLEGNKTNKAAARVGEIHLGFDFKINFWTTLITNLES